MKKSVCLFFLLILMLLSPKVTVNGAANGLLLWYSSVVPALFPFMVLSSLIVSGGGLSVLMAPFRFILGPLLGLSDAGCYVLISGLVCGFPMGAKTCADFLLSGQISRQEGRLLMAICNHPSPMFLLGYAAFRAAGCRTGVDAYGRCLFTGGPERLAVPEALWNPDGLSVASIFQGSTADLR